MKLTIMYRQSGWFNLIEKKTFASHKEIKYPYLAQTKNYHGDDKTHQSIYP